MVDVANNSFIQKNKIKEESSASINQKSIKNSHSHIKRKESSFNKNSLPPMSPERPSSSLRRDLSANSFAASDKNSVTSYVKVSHSKRIKELEDRLK